MNENLPFNNCSDDDLRGVFFGKRKNITTQCKTTSIGKKINMEIYKLQAQHLPFYNCSDYTIQIEAKSNT